MLFVLIFPVPGGILDAYMNYEFHTAKGEETSNGTNKEKKKRFLFLKIQNIFKMREEPTTDCKSDADSLYYSVSGCALKIAGPINLLHRREPH